MRVAGSPAAHGTARPRRSAREVPCATPRVGDSVARVRELENIRSFITGNGLTLVLDLAFTAGVVDAVVACARVLAGSDPA